MKSKYLHTHYQTLSIFIYIFITSFLSSTGQSRQTPLTLSLTSTASMKCRKSLVTGHRRLLTAIWQVHLPMLAHSNCREYYIYLFLHLHFILIHTLITSNYRQETTSTFTR
jgi:hypothetical protein